LVAIQGSSKEVLAIFAIYAQLSAMLKAYLAGFLLYGLVAFWRLYQTSEEPTPLDRSLEALTGAVVLAVVWPFTLLYTLR
jgi:hypothetical protein